MHRLLVTEGDAAGQLQGRERLLLDASAGEHTFEWPLYRSVLTVTSLVDAPGCVGCWREAITSAGDAPKPTLIQFAPQLAGSIVLSEPPPPLVGGNVTIDGFNVDGEAHTRSLDGNGFSVAALKIVSADNAVFGLRITNVGGNSDAVLLEGAEANHNLLESLQIVERGVEVCEDGDGCVVDGTCRTPATDPPVGACGDDGIAVRSGAGIGGANVIRDCDITGAFDKAVKASEGGVARVERCHIRGNADGGLQATLSGHLIATENLIEDNRGTNSANGIAANGPQEFSTKPARLETNGNIIRSNALRGISVRSLSIALLRDDYVCGNGTPGTVIAASMAIS